MTAIIAPPRLANHRVILLDVLRVLLALLILLYHSIIHLHCDYGIMNVVLIRQTIPMTLFFVLSGYSLQMTYGAKFEGEGMSVKVFYAKRLAAIWPLYMVCTILAIIMNVGAGNQTISDNLFLMPVEILGLQSVFPGSLFNYASNSGTWFVSCLFVSYALYPVLARIVNRIVSRNWLPLLGLILLWFYFSGITRRFDVQFMYTNPMMRLLEFLIGMVLANNLTLRSTQVTPLLKPLVYFSNLSLALFLGQGFIILPLKYCIKYNIFPFELSNIQLIMVVIVFAYIVAILLHEAVEMPSKRFLNKKLSIVR